MRGIGLVLYGGEGTGKTSWASQWSKIGSTNFFEIDESGIEDLRMVGDIPDEVNNTPIDTFEELLEGTKESSADVDVYDSLMGIQTDLFDYVCRTKYNGRWDGKDSFTAYWKGQRVDSPPIFNKWLDMLSRQISQGKHVLLLGHMFTVTLPNSIGADYQSHVVSLDDGDKGGMRSTLMRWAPNVLFLNIDVDIERSVETERGKVMSGKAYDTDRRYLYTHKSPGHAAKNRLKLPPVIPMGDSPEEGFENFMKALPKQVRENLL